MLKHISKKLYDLLILSIFHILCLYYLHLLLSSNADFLIFFIARILFVLFISSFKNLSQKSLHIIKLFNTYLFLTPL